MSTKRFSGIRKESLDGAEFIGSSSPNRFSACVAVARHLAGLVFAFFVFFSVPAPAQMCTPEFCEFPPPLESVRQSDAVAGVSHGFVDAPTFAAFLREKAFGGDGAADPGNDARSFPVALVLAFLAGLALNLSPCVLPMIPVQLAVLGMGGRAPSRKKGLLRGIVYGLSLALTYGALGIVAVASGAVFGQIQSLPVFNFTVGLVFIVLSLALFGVLPIDLSRFGRKSASAFSYAGLFLVGTASALLAGACVAPAVIAAVVYAADAYAAGSRMALFLPLALGCGMAAPWPFIGAGLSVLPRPGRWMKYVEWGFAVLVLALALKHFKVAVSAFGSRDGKPGVYEYPHFDEVLSEAMKGDKPVVVDFFASWCGSCDTMEKKTFSDPEVKGLLAKTTFLRIRVEDPGEPEAEALLARFGVRGFPAVVVLRKQD